MSAAVDYTADAVRLGAAGFRVFPLHMVGDKVCRINDWPNRASTDPEAIVEMFLGREVVGIGAATGDDLTVADIDVPSETHHHDGHASLKSAGVELPKTLTIKTRSGGQHLIYRTAGGARKTVGNVPGPDGEKLLGVDVRGTGGFFKVHDVEALIDGVAQITDAPDWLPVAGEGRQGAAKGADFLTELQRLEDQGGAGVSQTFIDLVATLQDRTDVGHDEMCGLTLALAMATSSEPGGFWAFTEAQKLYVRGAAERGDRGVDYAQAFADAYLGCDVLSLPPVTFPLGPLRKKSAPTPAKVKKDKPRKLGDLMGRTFPEMGWVVPGVIPEGATLLVSAPKLGKSLGALDWALACATGRNAFGSIPTGRARPVLYLDLESGERRLQARVTAQGWDEYGTFSYHLDAATAIVQLERFMRKHRGKRPLVILDPLAAVMTDRGDKTQQYKHEYDSLKQLQTLTASDPGAAIIVIHHSRKLESSDPLAMASGTHGLTGAVDHIFVLTRPDRMRTDGVLSRISRDVDDAEFELRLVGARWLVAGGSAEDAQREHVKREHERKLANLGPLKNGLLQVVEDAAGATLSIDVICDRYGGSSDRDSVGKALRSLAAAQLVDKVGRGAFKSRAVTA